MTDFFHIPDAAFDCFLEPLQWQQGRSPNSSSMVKGSVHHGRVLASSYSSMGQGTIKKYTDAWTVIIPAKYGECQQMTKGDTLTRLTVNEEKLTIQSIVKDECDWVLSVSSSTAAN